MSLFKKNLLTITAFFILMVVSTTIFLLSGDQGHPIYAMAFGASLFCDCIALLLFLIMNLISVTKSKLIELARAYTTLLLYCLFSLSLSILFPIYFTNGHIPFLVIQFILFAAAFTVLYLYYSSGKAAIEKEEHAADQVSALDIIESTLFLMYNNAEYASYSIQLHELCEAFKSTDRTSYTDTDKQIGELVYALHTVLKSTDSEKDGKVLALSDEILQMIRHRVSEVII